jgi:putative hydrolase of the HAD superfamily
MILPQGDDQQGASAGVAPRRILFDAVGTLIEADPPVVDAYLAAGERHGAKLSREAVHQRFRAAYHEAFQGDGRASSDGERCRWQRVVEAVFRELPDAQAPILDELWQHFSRPTSWRLFDDAAALLARLRAEGWQVGIASNFDDRLVGVCQGHAALAGLPLFWSTDVGYSKPDPRFFVEVARRLHLAPRKILLVGDDEAADFQGARAAGWQAILLDRRRTSLVGNAIRTLADLPALLASPTGA